MPWAGEWKEAITSFEQLLKDAGATNEGTHAVHLRPVSSSSDFHVLNQARLELEAKGFSLASRGAQDGGARLFAYQQLKKGTSERFGTFLWLSVHSSLTAWWLISAWRTQQLAQAAQDLFSTGELVAAAACTRSLVETAAVIREDSIKASQLWEACKQFAPSISYPLPSSAYKPLHDYVLEMLFGGKFKGDIPDDIAVLVRELPERKSVQTPIDRLSKMDSSIATTYDLLCNTVHPSVGGTYSYLALITQPGPGEVQIDFQQRRLDGESANLDDVLTTAIKTGILRGLHWITETLDGALRLCDDIALTTRVCHVAREPYWRAVIASDRNSQCVCRSGRKSKSCRHEWGSDEYAQPWLDEESP
jgi:hypothetical protein